MKVTIAPVTEREVTLTMTITEARDLYSVCAAIGDGGADGESSIDKALTSFAYDDSDIETLRATAQRVYETLEENRDF